jgi:methyltransferase-like protein 6
MAAEACTKPAPSASPDTPFVYAPYARRQSSRVSEYWVSKYEREATKYWDLFYRRHTDHFFKDRHYLANEWSVLRTPGADGDDADGGCAVDESCDAADDSGAVDELLLHGSGSADSDLVLLEAGCGVGNTLFPLLRSNPRLRVFGFDCSETAVEIVNRHPLAQAGRVTAAVGDLTAGSLPDPLAAVCAGRCDIATLMFVLSAISPGACMEGAIDAAAAGLKEGGLLLIRDYADGDGAQKRLQSSSKPKQLDEAGRFFVRADGTRAYYFQPSELSGLVEARGFEALRCDVREQQTVNRAKDLSITRRFLTATFRKTGRRATASAPRASMLNAVVSGANMTASGVASPASSSASLPVQDFSAPALPAETQAADTAAAAAAAVPSATGAAVPPGRASSAAGTHSSGEAAHPLERLRAVLDEIFPLDEPSSPRSSGTASARDRRLALLHELVANEEEEGQRDARNARSHARRAESD